MNVPQEICLSNLVDQITFYVDDDGPVPDSLSAPHTWLQEQHKNDQALRSLRLTSKPFYRAVTPHFRRRINVTSFSSLTHLRKTAENACTASHVDVIAIHVEDEWMSGQTAAFNTYLSSLESGLPVLIPQFRNLRAFALSYRRTIEDTELELKVGHAIASIVHSTLLALNSTRFDEFILDLPTRVGSESNIEDFLSRPTQLSGNFRFSVTDNIRRIQHLRVQAQDHGFGNRQQNFPNPAFPANAGLGLFHLLQRSSNLVSLSICCDTVLNLSTLNTAHLRTLQVLDLTRVMTPSTSLLDLTKTQNLQTIRSLSLREVQLQHLVQRRGSCKNDDIKELYRLLHHVEKVRGGTVDMEQREQRELQPFPTSLTSPSNTIPGNWFAQQSEQML
ncbi:uncharacterized protein KY384_002234 [Bacidia gigantensis]|uniref:uncharacterized protein n=1 Tax=Bacidia gigantensis TaxID=2732470 RepID=UPI001D05A774|nr:uncharacterized protein KY384_002234 [Bacidia gigantensis]KAG8533451.1 hypothetical protein KY384_002234 [Bacidia gigantensis]